MFYDRYKMLCEKRGESPSKAATKAGFNKGTVSIWRKKYIQGIDVDPDKSVVEKICKYFDIQESEFRGFGALDAILPPNMQGVNLTGAKVDSRFLSVVLSNLNRLGVGAEKYESTKNAVLDLAKSSGLEKMARDYIAEMEQSQKSAKNPPAISDEGISPLDARLNELLASADEDLKRTMISLLERTQKD